MQILIELDDEALLDVADDEMIRLVSDALSRSHTLDNGELLFLGTIRATVASSAWSTPPSRSFRAWLKTQRERNDPIGDLARDADNDPGTPTGRAAKNAWYGHLIQQADASTGAVKALDEAWSEFIKV